MIVILKQNAQQEQIARLKEFLVNLGLRIDESRGDHSTVLGLVGDTTRVDAELIGSLEAVEAVRRVQEPYKEVFSLRVFGQLSFRQIGDLFGKTESWARVTYHRARLKIKEEMK